MNRTIVSGRWVRDPQLKYTPQGTPVTSATIAVNDGYGDKKKTYYFDVVIWGKRGENVCTYSKKGDRIEIDGKLTSRSYENNEGKKVKVTEIVADDVIFVETRGGGNQGGSYNNQGEYNSNNYGHDPGGYYPDVSDDDLPF